MRSHFELSPADYEARRQGHLHRRRIELVEREVAAHARPGDLVLELGCGPGDVLAALAGPHPDVEFLGVDVDQKMVEHARTAHGSTNVSFELVDLSAAPFERRARVVFAIDVLHHVHALSQLVRSVGDLLETDGVWTVIEPNSRNPYIWLHQERMRRAGLDEAHFHRDAFERDVAHSGLRILESSTAFVVPGFVRSVPRPVARVERMLERVPVLGGSVIYRIVPA
ncbi:MAG TPA: class I SAM-dependent methyltransferase [Gaiella sp.]|nr:class I SAM-dependent methyltransferase [Gaiella sp.]